MNVNSDLQSLSAANRSLGRVGTRVFLSILTHHAVPMADGARLDASAVRTVPGQADFALVPVLGDILRTRFCIPGSIFLVEDIAAAPVSKSGRWQAIRLLLGDGKLCIQALLSGEMHRFVDAGEIAVGNYVRVDQFDVKWRDVAADDYGGDDEGGQRQRRQMVYLVVDDLVTIGWDESYRVALRQQTARDSSVNEDMISHHDLDQEEAQPEHIGHTSAAQPQEGDDAAGERPQQTDDEEGDDDGSALEDAFDTFEVLTFPPKGFNPTAPAAKAPVSDRPSGWVNKPLSTEPEPIALARDWHDPQTPLKLTTLRAVPHLPYAQNWSCNVLAIVASLSPAEPSHLAPYRQRTARLADPSTAKQVHLTVFLDPDDFEPAVGAAVLLVGVKNHRFDGGSLKKYASDGRVGEGGQRRQQQQKQRWWFQDPWEMGWCDVGGIRRWWEHMQST